MPPSAVPVARLRPPALIALLLGAAGSLGLMFHVGRRNRSELLLVLFVVWVLSPFVVLAWADVVSKRWAVLTRATLYGVMLTLTLGSLTIYGRVAFGPPRPQPASAFLVVPPVSWLLTAIALGIAARISRKHARGDPNQFLEAAE